MVSSSKSKFDELASIVAVRNHLNFLINGPRTLVLKDDVPRLAQLINALDQEFISKSLKILDEEYSS